MDLTGKRICLLGLGVENRAVGAWLAQRGLAFTVCDTNAAAAESVAWAAADVHWRLGAGLPDLTDFDILFRSPGIPIRRADLAAARQAGVRLSSGVELFLDRCPVPVIGITGTKGKGTTSCLLVAILQAAAIPVRLGGNIGTPPLSFLDDLGPQERVVLELSSFQLQDLGRSPQGAVLLPVAADHLDYHATEAEYIAAKGEICRHQDASDWVLAAADCPTAKRLAAASPGQVLQFSGARQIDGDGCWADGNHIWWRHEGAETAVASCTDVRIPGGHNVGNACAATAAALLAGAAPSAVSTGLQSFTGLPHRLERVAERAGILYVNDSLATTPEAASAGVLAWPDRRIVLIAGGSSKGAVYDGLGQVIARHVAALVTLGAEGAAIVQASRQAGYDGPVVADCVSMSAAVHAATQQATAGDVVLLSPACASFGMFSGYAERGEAFGQAARSM